MTAREHPSEAERPPQRWRDRNGVVWCLDDDPDLAWRDCVRACDSPTRTRYWVEENLGPLEPIAEGVQPTAREHPSEAQAADTEPTWEDVIAAIADRLWKLTPDDYQRFAHKDLTFITNMQDLMECVREGVDDVLGPDVDASGPDV